MTSASGAKAVIVLATESPDHPPPPKTTTRGFVVSGREALAHLVLFVSFGVAVFSLAVSEVVRDEAIVIPERARNFFLMNP